MQRTLSSLLISLVGSVGLCLIGCGGSSGEGPRQPGTGGTGSDADASATTGGTGGTDAPQFRTPWAISGVIGTGQSLSVGAQAPGISTNATQPHFNNLKLSLGGATVWPFDPAATSLALVPLVEPIRPNATTYPSAYPANMYGESPHAAMAAQITQLAQAAGLADYVTAHSVVGESGQGMPVINKTATEVVTVVGNATQTTGRAYAATLFEASAIERLATEQSKTYGIGAIILTHGETDSGNPNYEADMRKLWSDYNTDLKAITGQTESIPMFVSQTNALSFTAGMRIGPSLSMIALWKVGVDYPGEIVCTGPKYQYPYFTDNLHLVTRGYELYGEKLGEIYFEKVVRGVDWQPLQPTTVERAGRVVTVHFHVPNPPLAWDEALPAPFQGTLLSEWAQGRGFELRTGNTALAIESVAIVDDSVQITAAADVPAGVTLGYAVTTDGVALPSVSVRRGQLKDSDALVGAFTGETQANYAVAFELPVP